MRITKRQLRRIIREAMPPGGVPDVLGAMGGGKFQPRERSEDEKEWEDREWERGYQDGLDGMPPADDASTTYDAGYEDGTNDADMPGGDLRDRER